MRLNRNTINKIKHEIWTLQRKVPKNVFKKWPIYIYLQSIHIEQPEYVCKEVTQFTIWFKMHKFFNGFYKSSHILAKTYNRTMRHTTGSTAKERKYTFKINGDDTGTFEICWHFVVLLWWLGCCRHVFTVVLWLTSFFLSHGLTLCSIWNALRDLVPLAQFKKREKHQWRSFTFSACNFTKSNNPPRVFFKFFKL